MKMETKMKRNNIGYYVSVYIPRGERGEVER